MHDRRRCQPSRAKRAAALVLLAAASVILGGCVGDPQETRLELAPHHRVEVIASGSDPFVEVTNYGPGTVTVQFPHGRPAPLVSGTRGKLVRGAEPIHIETDDERAEVVVTAQDSSGIWVDGPDPR